MLKNIKRLAALILCVVLALSCVACAGGNGDGKGNGLGFGGGKNDKTDAEYGSIELISEYQDTMTGVFDDKNIVLTFAALSDTHMAGNKYQYDSSYNILTSVINQCEQFATTKKLDAVCFAGDIGNCTNSPGNILAPEEGQTREEAQVAQGKIERENLLRAIIDSTDPATKLFYCLGNHDSRNGSNAQLYIDSLSGKNKQYYNRFFGDDLDKEAMVKGNRHVKINGYSFVALEADCDDNGYKWLENTLNSIVKENPQQTIFVFHHYAPASLAFASAGQNKKLRTVLEKFPQVIVFSGHTHSQIDFDNAMMQSDKGFISMTCGGANNLNEGRIVTTAGGSPLNAPNSDMKGYNQGLVVEVDKNGNVRISRYNFKIGKKTASSYVIPAVKKDGTRSLDYTKDRKDKISAPVFISGDISAQKLGKNIKLKFPAAASPTQKIYRYEITITNTATNEKSGIKYVSSLFYKFATPAECPQEFDVTFEPGINIDKGTYRIEVVAVDSWPLKSKPLTYELVVK